MNYFENLSEQMILANNKALHEAKMDRLCGHDKGKANAWDNKKAKTCKRMRPRGKVYVRMVKLELRAYMRNLQSDTLQQMVK